MGPRSLHVAELLAADIQTSTIAVDETGDELALVARIRSGDERAFEVVFRTYYEPLCAFVSSYVGVRELAEERVHDVLFRFWRHRSELVVRQGLRLYLYGAARNEALNCLRHRRVVEQWTDRAGVDGTLTGMSEGPEHPDERAQRHEIEQAIAAAIARLPERRRLAMTLRVQHRFSNAEIAALMGISVKGVEMAVTKALRTLRAELAHFFL